MKTPVLPHLFPPTSTCFHRLSSTDGQGGGTPGCFPNSIPVRFSVIHINATVWRHVRDVGGWATGGRRAQVGVFAKEK